VRVETLGIAPGARVISFLTPDGEIISQLMNSNKTSAAVNLSFHGKTLHLDLPPISMTTALWKVH
jgi:O-glycosyl hydrolase